MSDLSKARRPSRNLTEAVARLVWSIIRLTWRIIRRYRWIAFVALAIAAAVEGWTFSAACAAFVGGILFDEWASE